MLEFGARDWLDAHKLKVSEEVTAPAKDAEVANSTRYKVSKGFPLACQRAVTPDSKTSEAIHAGSFNIGVAANEAVAISLEKIS